MKTFTLAFVLLIAAWPVLGQDYTIENTNGEYRMYHDGHHFLSLIYAEGIHAFRPHPGFDINGWGSTWYAQPFLWGAVLGYTNIDSVMADDDGIICCSSGQVSMGQNETYGQWGMEMHFEYDADQKLVAGTGEYHIVLDSALSPDTKDMSLYKIASNYVIDVPLLCDTLPGNTGDMEYAVFDANTYSNPETWTPGNTNLFIWQHADTLSVDVAGCYNNVDTEAQGYDAIEPAYKPDLKITLQALDPGYEMIAGGVYDTTLSQDFWEDNVGITPVILDSSSLTEFSFTVGFEAEVAVPQVDVPKIYPDNNAFYDSIEITIDCDTATAGIFYTLDGTEPKITSTPYTGTFYIDTTTTIKAKAYKCGLETSAVAEKEYVLLPNSIRGQESKHEIRVFPNPATNIVNISIEEIYENVFVDVLNAEYKQMLQIELKPAGGIINEQIDLSQIPGGIYLIRISGESFKHSEKIVVF